jgi:hypothetical protein
MDWTVTGDAYRLLYGSSIVIMIVIVIVAAIVKVITPMH